MTSKRKSVRPAESGWLLEIGVLGVAKSLLWMEKTGRSLLEIEHILRAWGVPVGLSLEDYQMIVSKRRKVARAPWANSDFEWDATTWEEFLSREESKLKRTLTGEEWENLAQDYSHLNDKEPGLYEREDVSSAIEEDELTKKRKGTKGGKPRASLERWTMDKRTALIINATSGLDSDQRKKLRKIKASSRVLGDLLEVLSGKLAALPKKYPSEVEKSLGKNGRKQLAKILRISVYGPGRWFRKLLKARLRKSRLKVILKREQELALKERQLKALRKKWGVRR
jgi:hypothetical protein